VIASEAGLSIKGVRVHPKLTRGESKAPFVCMQVCMHVCMYIGRYIGMHVYGCISMQRYWSSLRYVSGNPRGMEAPRASEKLAPHPASRRGSRSR